MRLSVHQLLMVHFLGACSLYTRATDEPDLEWVSEGRDFTATPDGRVVAVGQEDVFEATLQWPVGWLDEDRLCVALRAWIESTRTGRRGAWLDQTVAPGVTVDRQLPESCGPHHASVTLRGPGQVSVAAIEHVLDELQHPSIASPAAAMSYTMRLAFHGRTIPVETALRGGSLLIRDDWPPGDPVVVMPSDELAVESVLQPSLRALGARPAELRYAGPATASELASVLPGRRHRDDPGRLARPGRDAVHLWPTLPNATTSMVVVGPEWQQDHEGLLQLFEALLRVTALEESVDLDVAVVRPSVAGRSHLMVGTKFNARTPAADAVDMAQRLLVRVPVTEAQFSKALTSLREELRRTPPPGALAIELGGDLDRGLERSRRQEAWEQLQSVTRGELDAYLREWTHVLVTWVATGSHADFERWPQLGDVTRFESLRGPAVP